MPRATIFFLISASCILSPITHAAEQEYPAALQNFHFEQSSIDADTAFLRSLGLDLPADTVKQNPYSMPLGARSFVNLTSAFSNIDTSIQYVAPKQLALDLYILELAFQKAYGGFDLAAKKGLDWNKFFGDWRTWLESLPEDQAISVSDAFAPYFKLKSIQVDNHSFPALAELLSKKIEYGSVGTIIRSTSIENCTRVESSGGEYFPLSASDKSQAFKRRQLFGYASEDKIQTGHYLSHPRAWGSITSASCDEHQVDAEDIPSPAYNTDGFAARQANILNLMHGSNSGRDLSETRYPIYRTISETVSSIRIPSLTLSKMQQIESFELSLPRTAGSEKVLVIDLRQNGGGFDTPAADRFYASLKAWPELNAVLTDSSNALDNMTIKNPCIADALKWGDSQTSLVGLTTLDRDSIAVYQQQINKILSSDSASCPVTMEEHPGKWNLSMHKFNPEAGKTIFLVLVDNNCGSDCEWMTEMLAKSRQTLIAGSNTFGVLQFVQPGMMILSNTKIPFTVARGFSDLYGDNRSIDGYGIDVDVVFTDEDSHSEQGVVWLAKQLAVDPSKVMGN